uniref:Outer mitochondrial transmembrane helix translocase n=1 Tax=Sinocyclocheilus rhinocerous TaxID=307959 RepID=A0A673GPH5_9TELE
MLSDIPRDALLRPLTRNEVVGMLVRLTIFGAATYYSIKWVVEAFDPTQKQKNQAKKRAEQLMKQIGVEGVSLTEYEMNIATLLVDPRSIKVTWRDVAGLDEIISELQDTVILPFQKRHLFCGSKLLQPPKGVLLYGPPGCGKTLIAKATAKASGCRFINLQASIGRVFSLAVKIQPCIIFIDEIDSFLRNRSSMDHEATAMMKAQFMSLWDGLDTNASSQVTHTYVDHRMWMQQYCTHTHLYALFLLIGCLNQDKTLDQKLFLVQFQNAAQREEILRLILSGENLSNAINLKEIADQTEGYSGSDLKELCRDAAMYRVRDYVRKQQMKQIAQQFQLDEEEHVDSTQLRPVTQLDLLFGLDKMRESKQATATADPANLREVPLD